MLLLAAKDFARAQDFILSQGRPLEQALFAYYFGKGVAVRESVDTALAAFQNTDGGFGHGLEPDLRLADSSVIATTVALQLLRELGAGADHPLVQGAIRYLLAQYDAAHDVWLPVPPSVDSAPHAPWWTYSPDPAPRRFNPRAEIAGFLVQWAALVPAELCEPLVARVVAEFEAEPDRDWAQSHDDLLCLLRLAQAPRLPTEQRERILRKLAPAIRLTVATDPAAWEGYVMKPLKLVRWPGAPFADLLAAGIQAQLDREIAAQGEDGAWRPYWSWFGSYDETWPVAEREWKGRLTLDMLLTLRAFRRLA